MNEDVVIIDATVVRQERGVVVVTGVERGMQRLLLPLLAVEEDGVVVVRALYFFVISNVPFSLFLFLYSVPFFVLPFCSFLFSFCFVPFYSSPWKKWKT